MHSCAHVLAPFCAHSVAGRVFSCGKGYLGVSEADEWEVLKVGG
jgi:hypothetical protein